MNNTAVLIRLGLNPAEENRTFRFWPNLTPEGYALMLEEDGGCESSASLMAGTQRLIQAGRLVVVPEGIVEFIQ